MARLDVFVCDKCDTRVINTGSGPAALNWVMATFPYVFPAGRGGSIGDPKDMLLCPRCVRDIHEAYPKSISEKTVTA